jgi:hypothetical protein
MAAALVLAAGCRRPVLGGADDREPSGGVTGDASPDIPGAGGTGGGGLAGSTGSECARFDWNAQAVPHPDILILLDASGSMNDDIDDVRCDGGCGGTSKWAQAAAALRSLVPETDTIVNWGLRTFPDSGTSSSCTVFSGVTIPVGAGQASAINDAIAARTSVNGGVSSGVATPMRDAVQRGAAYLASLTDDSPRFILLLTDGAATCGPAGTNDDDSAGAVEAVAAARAAGVPTIVAGTAAPGSVADTTLTKLALAGGSARSDATPAYYPVSSLGDLTATIRGLGSRTSRSCVFALPPAPNGTPRSNIGVRIDGVDLPFDPSHVSGWDFTDPSHTAVQIFGAACADVMAGRIATVTIVFRCQSTK